MDRAAAVDLVRGLVDIPSLSRGEAAAARWLAERMRNAGYDRAFVDEAGNAVGEIGAPDAPRTVILLGHIDTVPGAIPVRIESTSAGEMLYGRGSVDAKGPLATFAAAVARLGAAWAHAQGIRIVVVGAVEEEAATSKGARFVAARFDGKHEPVPDACVIGEPSHWHRITLGYKGRLLLDVVACQPMAHTAGPDASVAAVVVEVWNWVTAHAARINHGRDKAFDQLSPSLRRFVTSTTLEMLDTAEAQFAWRLPLGFDSDGFMTEMVAAAAAIGGARTRIECRFHGVEQPWRGDRHNGLVRSFLSAIRDADPHVQPGFVLKTGTSDMNVVAPVWRCPIVAYGPGDSALDHTPHEHLSLNRYWRAITVLEAALRSLGGEPVGEGPSARANLQTRRMVRGGAADLKRLPRHPFPVERVADYVARPFLRHNLFAHQRGEGRLHARGACEAVPGPYIGGQQFAAVFDHDGTQRGALGEREALPRFFKDRVMLAEQADERAVQVVEPRGAASGRLDVVPHLMGEALDVVGHVAAELDDRRAQPGLRAHPARGQARLEKRRKQRVGDLFESHDRSGLVKRPAWSEHPLHQRWFGAGEHVANRALILDCRAKGVLHAAAVKGSDGLKLVERDRQVLFARRGNPAGEREHFGGEPGGVTCGADPGKGERKARVPAALRLESQFRLERLQQVAGPASDLAGRRFRRHQRPRVRFEKTDIRARRGDGHFHREDALPRRARASRRG